METILQYGVLVGVAVVFFIVCYIFLGNSEKPKKTVVKNTTPPLKKEKKIIDYASIYYDAKKRQEEERNAGIELFEEAVVNEHEAVQDAVDAAEATLDWHYEKPKEKTVEDLKQEALRIVGLQKGVDPNSLTEDNLTSKDFISKDNSFDDSGATKVIPVISEAMLAAEAKKAAKTKSNSQQINGLADYSYTYGKPSTEDLEALEKVTVKACMELGLNTQTEFDQLLNTAAIKKSFRHMQRAYVLNQTEWMLALAVHSFVALVNEPKYKAFYLILEKALHLLTSISEDELAALVAVLILKRKWDKKYYTKETFINYMEVYMKPFIDMVPIDSKIYEVLEKMKCIELVDNNVSFIETIGANDYHIEDSSPTISSLASLYETTLLAKAELTCLGLYLAEGFINIVLDNK